MCRISTDGPSTNLSTSEDSHPFTITRLSESTYMIRENDAYGEHPHIYAKLFDRKGVDGDSQPVMVLSDTGVGTTKNKWTIKTFLDSHFNINSLSYVIILSHCHYDHILGLRYLTEATIVSSGRDRGFVTPYSMLNKNSLCEYYNIKAPDYITDIWAADEQKLSFESLDLGITVLHTPGHTPDSLSWYDSHERRLFVGDSFYQQTSEYTGSAPWGPEGDEPIIFPLQGDVVDWWYSVDKLLAFVGRENSRGTAVKLCAGHVTAQVDAMECLTKVKEFMARILRGELDFERLPEREGHRMGHWKDTAGSEAEFSVVAPVALIEKARKSINTYGRTEQSPAMDSGSKAV